MKESCFLCQRPGTESRCEVCDGAICRGCMQRQAEDAFSFLKKIPADLAHQVYCLSCYGEKVETPRQEYEETIERAKEVFVFYTTQRKEIPLIRKSKEVFRVEECPDRDETILRLAFFAAQQGCNAIVNCDLVSEKIRLGAYQTSKWKGTASPAVIDEGKLSRQVAREQVWR